MNQSQFNIGNNILTEVDSYCYLGIEIHKSGSFSLARQTLKKKALRVLYSLKSTVNRSKLSVRSLTTLFDSLIKPIALYGAPICTPSMAIIKHLVKNLDSDQNLDLSLMKKISQTNSERVHLHYLKWALGVNKKACNAGIWGETGRYPLVIESLNLTLKYLMRLQNLDDKTLVKLALREQQNMGLDWYKQIERVLLIDPCYSMNHVEAHYRLSTTTASTSITPSALPNQDNFVIKNGQILELPKQKLTPNGSMKFRVHFIIKYLKNI